MYVHSGHVAVGAELKVDREQLAVRFSGGLAEGDPLSAEPVLDYLSCVCDWSLLIVCAGFGRRSIRRD
jgi:hypothetical protein